LHLVRVQIAQLAELCPYTTLFRSLTTYSIECRPGRAIHVSIMARNPTPTGSGSASPPHPSARTPYSSVRQHLSSSPCPPQPTVCLLARHAQQREDRKSTRLNSSHVKNSYA